MGGSRTSEARVNLTWPGPSIDGLVLESTALRFPEQLPQGRDPDDPAVRAAHTLAVARRAKREFERGHGRRIAWNRVANPRLRPDRTPVPEFDPARSRYASFRPSGFITFEYVKNGPSACLSHDIVVHEVCHALVYELREWLGGEKEDTRAVAECLGDVLALFSSAKRVEARRAALEECGGDLGESNCMSRFGLVEATEPPIRDSTVFVEYRGQSSAYSKAKALSGALYEALEARYSQTREETEDEVALLGCLEELADAVFKAMNVCPRKNVSVAQFAGATLRAASRELADVLRSALLVRRIGQEPDPHADIVARLTDVPMDVPVAMLLEAAGLTSARVVGSHLLAPRRRVMFPRDRVRIVDLQRGDGATLTLGAREGVGWSDVTSSDDSAWV